MAFFHLLVRILKNTSQPGKCQTFGIPVIVPFQQRRIPEMMGKIFNAPVFQSFPMEHQKQGVAFPASGVDLEVFGRKAREQDRFNIGPAQHNGFGRRAPGCISRFRGSI